MKWTVKVVGYYSSAWEIAVIRDDDEHGMKSLGWFGKTKHLVSHGGGANNPWPISKFVWDRQIEIAHALKDMLNNGDF